MMQSIDEERVVYSETSKKRGLNSSLTYWKSKNKLKKNKYKMLISSDSEG